MKSSEFTIREIKESIELAEKAVSQAQQKFMGMVHAMQKGKKIPGASKELRQAASTMKPKDVKDFAKTKHKGLPKHKTTEDLQSLGEKWGVETTVSAHERGKYTGKTKTELLKAYTALKKSGPHPKGSEEYGRMRELAFAIRAKSDWGKVE
jgi:membrane protease subunit (stomatin/prohibitin family)